MRLPRLLAHRRGGRRGVTPWERLVREEAARLAVSDRAELEALEAEVLEHGGLRVTGLAVGRRGSGLLRRLRRRR